MNWGRGNGLGTIEENYTFCAVYFCYYYYISSLSDHQALDSGVWGPPGLEGSAYCHLR